jgi:phosphoglucosamine mutase
MEQSDKLLLRSSSSEDTTPEMGIRIGHALAADYKNVVVGMDLVQSSPMMKDALVAGLLSSGANVIDIDIVSEPVAAFAAKLGDCCVYVTEFRQFDLISGYLLINRDGSFFGREQIRRLEAVDQQEKKLPDYKSIGTVKPYYNAIRHYNAELLRSVGDNPGGSMVFNCNCGTATDSAPQILNAIGTDIISINAQKDRNFVTSSLSVKEADIRHMKALVEANPGSIGISMNRVGNLMRVFDENGDPLTDEEVLALLVLYLRPEKLAVTMDVSWLISDIFKGRIRIDVNTPHPMPDAEKMKLVVAVPSSWDIHKAQADNEAQLAFYDGGYVFKDISYSPDAIHAAVILSQFSSNNNIRDVLDQFPEYFSESRSYKYTCSQVDFTRMMDQYVTEVSPNFEHGKGCWRVDMPEGGFFVSFDSENDDTVNVTAESTDKLYLVGLMEIIDGLMDKCSSGQ